MKQREIKFRIWDKKEEWWLFDYKEMGGFALLGEVVLVEGIREIPVERLEDFEVMQFTGLLDKNGKEIYEGDIFNCIYDYEGCKSHRFVVVWVGKDARFGVKSYGECQQAGVHQTLSDMERKEVMANIYKNPEILEGDK